MKIIKGGSYSDERGSLRFVNDFDMSDVKRFYTITHTDPEVVRAWQGHKVESKFFFCVSGSFTAAAVKVDDWDSPSANLVPEVVELTADNPRVLAIPAGCTNGFKANEPDSTLMVYSSHSLEDAVDDNYRFPADTWKL